MTCKHEWLVPSNKRTRCKRCGDDGWVSHDEKVHETYEACMKHDALSYGASPLSLPQNIDSHSSNDNTFKVSEGGYYRIGEQTVYLDADGTFKIKTPAQNGHSETQIGYSTTVCIADVYTNEESPSKFSERESLIEAIKQADQIIILTHPELSKAKMNTLTTEQYIVWKNEKQRLGLADDTGRLTLMTEGEK